MIRPPTDEEEKPQGLRYDLVGAVLVLVIKAGGFHILSISLAFFLGGGGGGLGLVLVGSLLVSDRDREVRV